MRLEFTAPVTASDMARRSISGRVVTWGEQGNTSAGPAVFEPGSLKAADQVILRLEHDRTRPLGRAVHLAASETGIDGVFRVADTSAGTDALVEASEELRAGLSVGATIQDSYHDEEGVIHVTAAVFDEVSLVTHPAIHSARVTQVAAAEEPEEPGNPPAPNESEEEMEETVTPVAAEELPQADTMQASQLATIAPTAPRVEFSDAADYFSTAVRAFAFKDPEAEQRVYAASQVTGDNPGVLPLPIIQPVITYIQQQRPVAGSSVWMGMPSAGQTFYRPKVTQHTVAGAQTDELSQLPSQNLQVERINVTKTTQGGSIQLSFQDRDWTDPAIMSLVLNDMAAAYANRCEQHICDTLTTNTSATTVPLAAEGTAKAEDYIKAIATASQHVITSIYRNPNRLYLSPDMWRQFVSITDSTGRPLFPRIGAMNAPGVSDGVTSMYLDVMGLEAVMSWQLPAGTCIVGYREALESFETLGGQVSVVQPNVLGLEMAFYGYWADLVTEKEAFVPIVQASSSGRK